MVYSIEETPIVAPSYFYSCILSVPSLLQQSAMSSEQLVSESYEGRSKENTGQPAPYDVHIQQYRDGLVLILLCRLRFLYFALSSSFLSISLALFLPPLTFSQLYLWPSHWIILFACAFSLALCYFPSFFLNFLLLSISCCFMLSIFLYSCSFYSVPASLT